MHLPEKGSLFLGQKPRRQKRVLVDGCGIIAQAPQGLFQAVLRCGEWATQDKQKGPMDRLPQGVWLQVDIVSTEALLVFRILGVSMKKLLVASIAATAFCGAPAFATDMPQPAPVYKAAPMAPAFSWTGCYLGGNVGGGWAKSSGNDLDATLDDGHHTASGVVGGGQIGCDYQAGGWVIGLQGMLDGAGLNGSDISPVNPAFTYASRSPWFGTLAARIGYAIQPTTLLYAKAGEGWLHSSFTLDAAALTSSGSWTRSGLIFGGGIEYMFAPNWSAFLEYDHMTLDNKILSMTNSLGSSFRNQTKQDLDAALVGINYRFGSR
jgi:outer membrane immunogenic protein